MVGRAAISGLRRSLSAALSLPARAVDAPPRSNASVPIHPYWLLERSGARVRHRKMAAIAGKLIELLVASLLVLVVAPASRGYWPASRRTVRVQFPGLQHPGVTERTLALRSPDAGASPVAHRLTSRQASALFRPRPMTDSPALPPLHSTPRPLQMKQAPATFVPSAANWRDSQEQLGRTRRHQWPRGFARP